MISVTGFFLQYRVCAKEEKKTLQRNEKNNSSIIRRHFKKIEFYIQQTKNRIMRVYLAIVSFVLCIYAVSSTFLVRFSDEDGSNELLLKPNLRNQDDNLLLKRLRTVFDNDEENTDIQPTQEESESDEQDAIADDDDDNDSNDIVSNGSDGNIGSRGVQNDEVPNDVNDEIGEDQSNTDSDSQSNENNFD